MENQLMALNESVEAVVIESAPSSDRAFLLANTLPTNLREIQQHHIIPVYSKDNEPLISHGDFIESALETVYRLFPNEHILEPSIRVSHPIKGRIPTARNKPAKDLEEWERTLYYERAAFVIEIPTIQDTVGGNQLSLTVGGVKSYNLDSLHQKKGVDENFKVFIGFQNQVCTNLCVWSDGYVADLRVKSVAQLITAIEDMILQYQIDQHLSLMKQFTDYYLTEQQFAQFIGRCRLYQYLPQAQRKEIAPMLLGDQQVGMIARDYYRDQSFCREDDGSISLWKVYNLFTGAVKSSYIDTFMDRNVNSLDLTGGILKSLQGLHTSQGWFLQ